MNHQKIIIVCMLMCISLALVWCGSNPEEVNTQETEQVAKVNPGAVQQKRPPRPQSPEELETNKKMIAAREEEATSPKVFVDNSWGAQSITASEILYAAKVGDSIEAHPAWLTVSVTLDDDVITWLDIQQQHSSPKSQRHQAQFAEQVEALVVGKKLSESNSVYLSVASSTSQAFNDSIEEIQELYAQSQT